MTHANIDRRQRATQRDGEHASPTATVVQTIDGGLVVKRVFDAPPELVFKAWSEPQHVAQWFGPCEVS
ncbi:MAG: hypothetical protein JWM03_143, partial [Rhodocyclales bacterium]|nr:hypothetical protein [Rhodocyclales bacterium]